MFLPDEQATLTLGKQFSKIVPEHFVIYLQGELGAGKTTFARGFLRGLGFEGKVKSPTFTFIEPYQIDHRQIFHMDFYRLEKPSQLEELGVRDYFDAGICLIEWPERVGLTSSDIYCMMRFKEAGREISLKAQTTVGQKVLQQVMEKST